tara:strand:+ start:355 stop:528 length:174 start_codon:yes stop_codon:yes gene_type:complete
LTNFFERPDLVSGRHESHVDCTFKITCTIEGKYLGSVVNELMKYYIENHAKDWKKSK